MNLARLFLDRSWFELSAAACSLPDNVLLLWTDSEAAGMSGKRKTWHAGEHVRHTLGMFRYLPRYSKKDKGR